MKGVRECSLSNFEQVKGWPFVKIDGGDRTFTLIILSRVTQEKFIWKNAAEPEKVYKRNILEQHNCKTGK